VQEMECAGWKSQDGQSGERILDRGGTVVALEVAWQHEQDGGSLVDSGSEC